VRFAGKQPVHSTARLQVKRWAMQRPRQQTHPIGCDDRGGSKRIGGALDAARAHEEAETLRREA